MVNGMIFFGPVLVVLSMSCRFNFLALDISDLSRLCGWPLKVSCFSNRVLALSNSSVSEQISLYLTA